MPPLPIHPVAARGFVAASEVYDRGRPDYPQPAIARLVAALGLSERSRVVELGAGTGKLTRLLEPRVGSLVAVEPIAEMRERLAAAAPGLAIVAAVAEALPLHRESADAVVVAQAFHWFDAPAALREIHRVLRPGGGLGLLWNARDESVAWVRRMTDLLDRYKGDTPLYQTGRWRQAFAGQALFGPLDEAQFRHAQVGPLAMVADRIAAISFIAPLPEPERARAQAEGLALAREAAEPDGTVRLPYRTDLYWCRRRG